MAVVKPVLYPTNVLEGAILTMTPSGAVVGKGTERLVDRDIGLECEDAGIAGQRIWHADQGLAPKPAGTWLLSGTGYAGKTVTLESSPDNAVWTPRASVVPVTDTPQRVDISGGPFTIRYGRQHLTGPAVPIRLTEWVLSVGVLLKFKPSAPNLREGVTSQVTRVPSGTGRTWGIKRGARRWSHQYVMSYSPDVDRLQVLQLLTDLDDGAKACWLLTVTGELRWVVLPGELDFTAADLGIAEWDIPLDPIEELP